MSAQTDGQIRAIEERLRAVERKADLNEERHKTKEADIKRLEGSISQISTKLWAVLLLVIGYVANQLLGLIGGGP